MAHPDQPAPAPGGIDADLVRAVAGGDTAAFARWLAEAEPALRRSLRSFSAVCDVEAVVQETLLRVWYGREAVAPHPGGRTLDRLAFTIGRRLAVDEARRAGRESPVAEPPEPPPRSDGLSDPLLRARIERCRRQLPAKPRAALDARLDAEGTRRDSELASDLGMRSNTFLQNLSRARRLLLSCLERAGVVLAEVWS